MKAYISLKNSPLISFYTIYLESKARLSMPNNEKNLVLSWKLYDNYPEIDCTINLENFFKNLSIICFNIFDYPYIYNSLDDIIIKSALNTDYPKIDLGYEKTLSKTMKEIEECLSVLVEKIKEKKFIFKEKKLKDLHISLIKFYVLVRSTKELEEILKIIKKQITFDYEIKFFLKDIDFCLKLFLYLLPEKYSDLKIICDKILLSFMHITYDKRIISFIYHDGVQEAFAAKLYFSLILQKGDNNDKKNLLDHLEKSSYLSQKQMDILDKSLKIKNTLIIGEKYFHDFIKNLKLPTREYYLQFNELKKFCSSFQDNKIDHNYMINEYFVIIESKNFDEYYKSLNLLSFTYGITFIIIIYINDQKNIYINKNLFNDDALMPIIICYTKEDIKEYFNDNEKSFCIFFSFFKEFENSLDTFDSLLNEFSKIKITDITECDNNWEMDFDNDANYIKNLHIINVGNKWLQIKTAARLFQLYKEYNNLELYVKYYCNYLGCTLYPETLLCGELLFLKSFIYAYTLDEGSKDKSFYAMLNDTLKSSDYKKINKIIEIFAKLLQLIKSGGLLSYKGKVYRAAYFGEDLLKQIKVGKKMINKAFWSSSKEEKVAKNFKKIYTYKNVIIYTNLNGIYNIDIDEEKLSRFPEEKEVLILPFCKFEVKSFTKIRDSKIGDYYKLELELIKDCNMLEHIKTKIIKVQEMLFGNLH